MLIIVDNLLLLSSLLVALMINCEKLNFSIEIFVLFLLWSESYESVSLMNFIIFVTGRIYPLLIWYSLGFLKDREVLLFLDLVSIEIDDTLRFWLIDKVEVKAADSRLVLWPIILLIEWIFGEQTLGHYLLIYTCRFPLRIQRGLINTSLHLIYIVD